MGGHALLIVQIRHHDYYYYYYYYYHSRLCKANRGGEARELLTELLATSNQVLGPHHNTTKGTEATLKHVVAEHKIVN